MCKSNKLSLKETITESRLIEKEISLPYYCQGTGTNYYYFVSEKTTIRVLIAENHEWISKVPTWLITDDIARAEETTEQDFKNAYYTALDALSIEEKENEEVEEDTNPMIEQFIQDKIDAA